MRARLGGRSRESAVRDGALALVVLLIAALYAAAARRLPVGVLNDDAAHVLLARSLWSGSYSFPGGLGSPEEFLPAFPLLLAVPVRLVAPHWDLLRAVPLAFAGLCLLLTWRLARRFLGVEASAAVVLLTALNPVVLCLAGLVMPYLPYLALSLALIDGAGAESGRPLAWLAAGAALAPLLRPQGAVLVVCLALAQWHRRGPRRAGAFLAAALAPALAWTLRNHLRAGSSLDYVDTWWTHVAAVGDAPSTARVSAILSSIYCPAVLMVPGLAGPVKAAVGAAALALAVLGARRLLMTRADPRVFVLAAYLAGMTSLHLTWNWINSRYAIPFVPLLWILIAAFAADALPRGRAARGLLAALFAALALRLDVYCARIGLKGEARFQPKTMEWIRANVPASARLASLKPYSVALLTGRECAPQKLFPRVGPSAELARRAGVGYLHVVLPRPDDEFVVPGVPAGYQPSFARGLDAQPEWTQVYRELDEGALVYRLDVPARASDPGRSSRSVP
jgi:hypothetical protein